jgi:hypothetical protein
MMNYSENKPPLINIFLSPTQLGEREREEIFIVWG